MLRFALLVCALPLIVSASVITTISIDVTQDGQDYLIIQGNTLEWEHLSDFANGGVTGGSVSGLINVKGNTVTANNPYILVSGTDSAATGSNFSNAHWYNREQGLQCGGGANLTCPYFDTLGEFTLPFSVSNPTLASLSGTTKPTLGILNILQQPNAGNGYTTIINFNDSGPLVTGTHEYKTTITLTDSTPEPATWTLCGIGLAGAAFLRRRKR